MRRKKWRSLLVVLCMSMELCSCDTKKIVSSQTKQIELIEPVNAELGYELAVRRNLYDADTYSATVVPYIEEYSCDKYIQFSDYGAYPGELVKKGNVLIESDVENINQQIEDKQEEIKSMEEAHLESMEDLEERLKEQQKEAGYWKTFVDINEKTKPAEYVDAATLGDMETSGQVKNPAYQEWEAQCGWVVGKYRIADHAANTTLSEKEQRTKLYELDRAHAQNILEQLYQSREEAVISSKMDGYVVAMTMMNPGDAIPKESSVTAVGDMNQKLLKCDYLSKNDIRNAKDIYVIIDGKRYEVEYQAMETEEYLRLAAINDKVYSTFTLLGGEDVNIGDFGMISVIHDDRKNVITVPAKAVRKDELGNYVYVIRDGENVYTPVKTGLSDNVYTEILEGVSEGDKILYALNTKIGEKREILKKGNFSTDFKEQGFMYYPSNSYLKNPVKNGVTYFVSMEVVMYQHVEKGDVIATVRVQKDDIALARNEKRLQRLTERLEDLQKQKKDDSDKGLLKNIANYEEQITELQDLISEQKKDFSTTKILADQSGIVMWMSEKKEEDILPYGEALVEIADENTCYVVVENKNQLLQYGNQVNIGYKNSENKECVTQGMVASVSKVAVNASYLQSDYTTILLPKEEIGNMSQTASRDGGWWNRLRYQVEGQVRTMENVVVVPKQAVWVSNGETYVYLVGEDGVPVAQSFVAGGFDDQNYWVVEGLMEGMEVCLE